jgi:hypothetical protein
MFSNLTRITGTSHEDLCKYIILTIRNSLDKIVENIKMNILC